MATHPFSRGAKWRSAFALSASTLVTASLIAVLPVPLANAQSGAELSRGYSKPVTDRENPERQITSITATPGKATGSYKWGVVGTIFTNDRSTNGDKTVYPYGLAFNPIDQSLWYTDSGKVGYDRTIYIYTFGECKNAGLPSPCQTGVPRVIRHELSGAVLDTANTNYNKAQILAGKGAFAYQNDSATFVGATENTGIGKAYEGVTDRDVRELNSNIEAGKPNLKHGPRGITFGADGSAFIADAEAGEAYVDESTPQWAIARFDKDMNALPGSGWMNPWAKKSVPGVMFYHTGVATMADGNYIATSEISNRLNVFSPDGTPLRQILLNDLLKIEDTANADNNPYSVAVDPVDGSIYVGLVTWQASEATAYYQAQPRLMKLSADGTSAEWFGEPGKLASRQVTIQVAVNPHNQHVFAWQQQGTIQEFDKDGTWIRAWQSTNNDTWAAPAFPSLNIPRDAAWDKQGLMYVTSAQGTADNSIMIFGMTPDPIPRVCQSGESGTVTLKLDCEPSAPTPLGQTPVLDYVVEQSTNGGKTWTVASDKDEFFRTASTKTVRTFTDVAAGTQFRVSAWNEAGNSDWTPASLSPIKYQDDDATTAAGTPVDIDVVANDVDTSRGGDDTSISEETKATLKLLDADDVAVDSLPAVSAEDPATSAGTFTVENGKIRFTPAAGFVGKVAPVSYQLDDCPFGEINVTVEATGSLVIHKDWSAPESAAITKEATFAVVCTLNSEEVYNESHPWTGEDITVENLPVGATCEVTEGDLTNFDSGRYTWTVGPASKSATSGAITSDAPQTVNFTNTFTERTPGKLTIVKNWNQPDGATITKEAVFNVRCERDNQEAHNQDYPWNGTNIEVTNLPVGSTCNVTEKTPAYNAERYTWTQQPEGAQTATMAADQDQTLTFTNTFTERTPGKLTIVKNWNQPDGATITKEAVFNVRCERDNQEVHNQDYTWNGTNIEVTNLPVGSTCNVTEKTPAYNAERYTWTQQPEGAQTATMAADQDQTLTFTNTFTERTPGALVIANTVTDNSAGDKAANVNYTFTVVCERDGSEVFNQSYPYAGEPIRVTGIPVEATCAVTEEVTDVPETVIRTNSAESLNNLLIRPEADTPANFSNTYDDKQPGSLVIGVTEAGNALERISNHSYAVTYVCGALTDTVSVNAGETTTISDIPFGTQCEVTQAEASDVPAGITYTLTDTGTPDVITEDGVSRIVFTNTYEQRLRTLQIQMLSKGEAADSAAPADYTVGYVCTAPEAGLPEVTGSNIAVANNGSVELTVPEGYSCKVTQSEPTISDPFVEYSINPADFTLSIGTGDDSEDSYSFVNTYNWRAAAPIVITNALDDQTATKLGKDITFNYEVVCTVDGKSTTSTFEWTGEPISFTPERGATCSVTQKVTGVSDNATLTSDVTEVTGLVARPSGEQTAAFSNVLQDQTPGALRITNSVVDTTTDGRAKDVTFTYAIACTLDGQEVFNETRTWSGSEIVINDLPIGAVCSVSEQVSNIPDDVNRSSTNDVIDNVRVVAEQDVIAAFSSTFTDADKDRTQTVTIKVSATGNAASVAPTQVTIVATCKPKSGDATEQRFTAPMGGEVSFTAPEGVECTFVQLPAEPTGDAKVTYTAPQQVVMTLDGDTTEFEFVNNYVAVTKAPPTDSSTAKPTAAPTTQPTLPPLPAPGSSSSMGWAWLVPLALIPLAIGASQSADVAGAPVVAPTTRPAPAPLTPPVPAGRTQLAVTGANVAVLGGIALVLIIAGAGLMIVRRRR